MDYCQTDVDPLGPLLERMLPAIEARSKGLGQALLRGRYTAAVARMERAGVPIDTELLEVLRGQWEAIKLDLISDVDQDYGVFDDVTFKADRFEAWLANQGIPWPRTESGRLALDQETFRQAARIYPAVAPLRELRHSLSELRLEKLAVGPDGRNRVGLRPFAARSGRNTPSSAGYIFGPSLWLRGLIRPTEGQALAYIDWSSQEIVIAAALSGDKALLDAVRSGDPYLQFAKLAGLAPAEATKETHKEIRDLCKTCMLGTNYGMGPHSLALRTGSSLLDAERLLRSLARTFPTFWEWAEYTADAGQLATVFGWPLHVTATTRPTTLRNFPMQANAAEMLRIASCLTTEAGVTVCAPVHDALLVEAKDVDLADVVNLTRALMAEASRKVLAGVEVATDVLLVRWPDRYADPRGKEMFGRVTKLLAPRWVEGAASVSGTVEGSSSL